MKAIELTQYFSHCKFIGIFPDAQGQLNPANSTVSGGIRLKFYLIQACMVTLITCKNEEDQIKNEGARVQTKFLPLCLWEFFQKLKGS